MATRSSASTGCTSRYNRNRTQPAFFLFNDSRDVGLNTLVIALIALHDYSGEIYLNNSGCRDCFLWLCCYRPALHIKFVFV